MFPYERQPIVVSKTVDTNVSVHQILLADSISGKSTNNIFCGCILLYLTSNGQRKGIVIISNCLFVRVHNKEYDKLDRGHILTKVGVYPCLGHPQR